MWQPLCKPFFMYRVIQFSQKPYGQGTILLLIYIYIYILAEETETQKD